MVNTYTGQTTGNTWEDYSSGSLSSANIISANKMGAIENAIDGINEKLGGRVICGICGTYNQSTQRYEVTNLPFEPQAVIFCFNYDHKFHMVMNTNDISYLQCSINSNGFSYSILNSVFKEDIDMWIAYEQTPFISFSEAMDAGKFRYFTYLTSINIPDDQGITQIPTRAFEDQRWLQSCTIPTGVEIINEEAFRGCRVLSNITIPNTVHSIKREAFAGYKDNWALPLTIDYDGTIAQFNTINRDSVFSNRDKPITVHCTDGDISL